MLFLHSVRLRHDSLYSFFSFTHSPSNLLCLTTHVIQLNIYMFLSEVCHTEETDEGGRLEVGPLVDDFLLAVVEPAETTPLNLVRLGN